MKVRLGEGSDGKRKDKKGTAFRVEIKEKAKMVDPQVCWRSVW